MSYMVIIWSNPPHIVGDAETPHEHWLSDSWDEAMEFCETNAMAHALGSSIIDVEKREMEFVSDSVFLE